MILTRCVPIRRLLGPLAFATAVSEAEIPPRGEAIQLFGGKSMEDFDTFVFGHGFNPAADQEPVGVRHAR